MAATSFENIYVGMRVRVSSDLEEVMRNITSRLGSQPRKAYECMIGKIGTVQEIDSSDQTVLLRMGVEGTVYTGWFVSGVLFATDGMGGFADSVLEGMWKSRAFTDAEVCCGDAVFPVHRAVLSAVSPVFAAMFGSSMTEGINARITIADAPAAAVEALLDFVYNSQRKTKNPLELIELAHKYEIKPLLMKCCEDLVELEPLSSETVVEILRVLRPRRDDEQVKEAWEKIFDKVCKDKKMMRAVCEAV